MKDDFRSDEYTVHVDTNEMDDLKAALEENMRSRNEIILKIAELGYEIEVHKKVYDTENYQFEFDTSYTIILTTRMEYKNEIDPPSIKGLTKED